MTDAETGALLAAASILLGVVTFIYGAAYPGLARAAELRLRGRQPADASGDRDTARLAVRRAAAVAFACVTAGAVFAPASFALARHFVDRLPSSDAFEDYNALAITFVLVNAVYVGLAVHAALLALRARNAERLLSGP